MKARGIFRVVAKATISRDVRVSLAKGAGYPKARRQNPHRLYWDLTLSVCGHGLRYPMTVVFGMEDRAVLAPPQRVKCAECGGA